MIIQSKMIIEICALLLALISGYYIGLYKARTHHSFYKSLKGQLSLTKQFNINNLSPSSKNVRLNEASQQLEINQEQKRVNKKKKNKKKKKQYKDEKQENRIDESNQIKKNIQIQQTKPNSIQKQVQKSLWSSTQFNSKSQSADLKDNSKIAKSCQVLQTKPNIKQSDQQDMLDFVLDEIQLIRNYFLDQFQQIIPFSKNIGRYRLNLMGTTKQMALEWCYNNSQYPLQPINIKLIYDSFTPIQIDKLDQTVNDQKLKMANSIGENKFYNYIFNLSTAIYQDLLMQIHQEPEQSFYVDNKQPNKQTGHHRSFNQDTSEILALDKKQIYGKLVEEIFYMQDFKSEPNDSLLINNQIENVQKKYHSRGRYINEFQQLEMIGQGGFGKVYKAKNRLDSNTYAIKKIAINYENSKDRKLLNQVTFLSTLNHPNIVRYHQSWLQDISSFDELIHDMSITQSQEKQQLEHIYQDWRKSKGGIVFQDQSKRKESKLFDNQDDDDIMFQEDDDIHFQGYSEIQFQEPSKSVSVNPNAKHSFSKISQEDSQKSQDEQKSDFPFKILYIVMEFVRGINLKEFITTRFKEDQIKIQIIRGILEGLAYIHSKKIIHRDLKPANIFLTQNNKVKIGDFGLATTGTFEQKAMHQMFDKSNSLCDFQKTIGIGTAFYRAPQQLKSPKYDEKVDIYSLGIIIFEMFYEFSTYSERFKILSDITKNFTLPKDFNLYGQLTDYQISIEICIKQQPQMRPTARKLLENFRNKYFVLLVSAIANPKYAQFYELIKHLFQISNERRIQSVKKNYFKSYDFHQIFNIYRIHRGNIFSSFPLVLSSDYKTINGFKIHTYNCRKDKLLVLSQQGVLLEYSSNLYTSWIIYAKQTMRKRKHEFLNNQLEKIEQIRRFTFEKIVQPDHDKKKDQVTFKEKYVTGFDICYDLEAGFSPFLTLEMFIISSSIVSTLRLTQQDPPFYVCHSKIYTILSKHYKIPPYKLYSFLLSTTEQNISAMAESKRLQYFEKYQIEGLAAKKISQLLDLTFEEFDEWIKSFQIWNIEEYTEYLEIHEQIKKIMRMNELFEFQSIEYKLMIPPNYCNGIFWNVGPIKGFTAIDDYNIGAVGGYLCNLNIQLTLSQGQDLCDVSIWSNQQFLESQIMELVAKSWKMGVSAKFYEQGMGQKDESSKMNMIVKKKKGERVHYYIRKNQNKRYADKLKQEEGNKQLSSVVLKQQFNHEIFKQIHPQFGSAVSWSQTSKKRQQ